MTGRIAISQDAYKTLRVPQRYLSSVDVGWEGLVAEAFHEPVELEGWMVSGPPDVSLVLFSGGTMRMEQRPLHGAWETLYMRSNDMLLTAGRDAAHEVRWQGISDLPMQTLHLHLGKELFCHTAEEVADKHIQPSVLMSRSGFQDPLLTQICLALWRELEQQAPAGKLYAQTAARMLAVHLLHHYSETRIHTPKETYQGLSARQMRRLETFIQERLSQDLTLEELAEQTGFSPYYFARIFRQTTGESPHQFVLRQRIERAQQLLAQRNISLVQVALESGFTNQSHFTRTFKRYLGMTPRAYRQERIIWAISG
ncbi:hypothetical protein KDW_55140 [Dictyobacter vulcani]|uniref:HTH araC/xylS-type domain-containing protein n=1 Tax=Dictyobacter vulcani TaxID=2607529 RepID=A0A5J4KW33_9CHLR|nr:AraC family transcriptional regulator [Dictyobacter vulcani]GER91352.1 hypothetical protein KDW_55140 [Dictyobacter vulcani]